MSQNNAYSSVAIVLAIGAIGGMVLTGWASQPRAALPPVVITLASPVAPVAPVPVAAAPVAAAPVAKAAAPVAAAPVAKAKRKAVRKAAAPVAHVVYLVPRWHGCTCSL